MGEALGAPDMYEAPSDRWRYPWEQWAGTPFVQWVLTPDTDFPTDERGYEAAASGMLARLHTHAKRKGLYVKASRLDPDQAGRLTFRFYDDPHQRPILLPFPASAATSAQVGGESDAPGIVCELCGAAQQRQEHLLQVKECLIRNPENARDPALYARHREDASDPTGLRKLGMVIKSWSLEDGPH